MGDFAFCSTFTEDYKLFLEKIKNGTLTEEELIEFDKKYGCKLEYTYYADQTPEHLRHLFKQKKSIYNNPIIKSR